MLKPFKATFLDGQTTHGHEVEVHLLPGRILELQGLNPPLQIQLAGTRVSARLGNTPRAITFLDGSRCDTLDHEAADILQRLTRTGLGMHLVSRLEERWRTVLAAMVLLLLLMGGGFKWGIPLLARGVAATLPQAVANQVGKGTLEMLDRAILKPSELKAAKKRALRKAFTAMAAGYPDLPLSLVFRRGIGPNALALPSGVVIVMDELVELARREEQILSVLAHEIGHVHHRHGLRMALEGSAVTVIVATVLGDAASVATISSTLPAIYVNQSYSRSHETEADTFALHYMDRMKLPRHHFADILKLMEKEAGGGEGGKSASSSGGGFTSSHPATQERIRRFE